MRLSDAILARRPGHIVALQARSSLHLLGSSPAHESLRIGDSAELVKSALDDGLLLLRLDPANADERGQVSSDAAILSGDYEQLGRPRDARATLQKALEILLASRHAAEDHGDAVVARYAGIARIDADLGERGAGEATLKEAEPVLTRVTAALGQDSFKTATAKCSLANAHARIALFNGDFKQAVDIARPVLDTSLTWKGLFGHVGSVIPCPSTAALIVGDADVMLGDYDAANTALGAAVPVAKTGNDWISRNYHASLVVLQSIAISRLGKTSEARALLSPVLEWQRARYARNHDDAQERLDYASALYALALTDSAHRNESLGQASAIIAALPAEMRSLKSTRRWEDRVRAERGRP
jgi:tetratricopeptide (TPR) repeat protein